MEHQIVQNIWQLQRTWFKFKMCFLLLFVLQKFENSYFFTFLGFTIDLVLDIIDPECFHKCTKGTLLVVCRCNSSGSVQTELF